MSNQSKNTVVHIRRGFGGFKVFANKPLIKLPIIHNHDLFDRRMSVKSSGNAEQGIISKDKFLVSYEVEVEFIISLQKKIIQKYFDLQNVEGMLRNNIITCLHQIMTLYDSANFNEETTQIAEQAISMIPDDDFESIRFLNLKLWRTPLNDYDLGNILHFKMAKEIVTQIANLKLRDKEFIEKSRQAIAHFDIFDE